MPPAIMPIGRYSPRDILSENRDSPTIR